MRLAIVLSVLAGAAFADPPDVVDATVTGNRVDVTILHPDTGWDHYADAWAVVDAQGNQLGLRVLAHPHESEQPFTRSLTVTGALPDRVFIRTRCIVDGWSQEVFAVVAQ